MKLKDLKRTLNGKVMTGIALSAIGEGMAAFKARVFFEGKAADGSSIGEYSKKPFYLPVKKQGKGFAGKAGSQVTNAGIKPRGKKKEKYVYGDFKNGNKRKSMYFKDGYYEYRATVQRKNEKVDLSLTNQLNNDIKTGRRGNEVQVAITTKLSIEKARGNEERFKKDIFVFSDAETAQVEKEMERLFDKLLSKITL